MAAKKISINILAFLVFGSILASQSAMVVVASEDLLAQTRIPSTVVLLTSSIPGVCIAITAPYFIQRFSYWCKTLTVTATYILAVFLLAVPSQVGWKLTGVALSSLGNVIGEFTYIPLTALHGESSVSAYFTGTGLGYCIVPFYYTGWFAHVVSFL